MFDQKGISFPRQKWLIYQTRSPISSITSSLDLFNTENVDVSVKHGY